MNRSYRLPPEWAPQQGVLLTWPHAHGDWQPLLGEVEPVYVELTRQISRFERLLIVANDDEHRRHISTLLDGAGIRSEMFAIFCAPSNDSWSRDHGPVTVVDEHGELRLLDFTFNGWGGKHPAELDDRLTRRLHEQGAFGGIPLEPVDLVLEGGAIEVDGRGGLLTTTRCLLSPLRNPDLGCQALEALFGRLFGIERTLWLENGHLAGDDTDSHIDTLARFCNPSTIAYVACDDPQDEHYHELKAMEAELHSFRNADGRPYTLVPLPWPGPVYAPSGKRLPATYANFLIINGAVLVPTYGVPGDREAIAVLGRCFPGREVIGVACTPLLRQYGSLHCATMQIPRKPS